MKFTVLLISALFAFSTSARAEGYRNIELEHADGTVTSLRIEPSLVMEFADGELMVTLPTGVLSLALDDLSGWRYVIGESSLGDVRVDESIISFDGTSLRFSRPVMVSVYGVDGSVAISSVETTVVNVSALGKGCYIVTADGETLKIRLR